MKADTWEVLGRGPTIHRTAARAQWAVLPLRPVPAAQRWRGQNQKRVFQQVTCSSVSNELCCTQCTWTCMDWPTTRAKPSDERGKRCRRGGSYSCCVAWGARGDACAGWAALLNRRHDETDVQEEQRRVPSPTLVPLKVMRVSAQAAERAGTAQAAVQSHLDPGHGSSSLLLVPGWEEQQTSVLFFSQPCLLLLLATDLLSSSCANGILFFSPKFYHLQKNFFW